MKIFIESPLVLLIHLLCDALLRSMRRPLDGPKNVVSSKGLDLATPCSRIAARDRHAHTLAKRNPETIVAGPRHMQRHNEVPSTCEEQSNKQ